MTWKDDLLPPDSRTTLDIALEESDAARFPLDTDAVRRTKDAQRVTPELLPALAWEYSDDLWSPQWDLQRQRNVVGGTLALQRLKGTTAGLRGYLEVVNAHLKQIITPPQAFYAGPDLTKEQWDSWIRSLPQIRVLVGDSQGVDPAGMFYAANSFAGVDFVTIDITGPELYGRRAFLRKNGVDTPLRIVTTKTDVEQQNAVDFETISTLGSSPDGFFAGVSFAGHDYAASEIHPAQLVTYALDRSYVHEESDLHLSTLSPGLTPINVQYERNSDIGDGSLSCFAGVDYAGERYAMVDDGWKLLADILYLNDPDVALPFVDSFGFAGVTRVGISPYTAEAMIQVEIMAKFGDFYAGETVAEEGYATAEDRSVVDEVQDAAAASLAARDKLLITLETTRPLTFADGIPLDGSLTFDSRLPAYL